MHRGGQSPIVAASCALRPVWIDSDIERPLSVTSPCGRSWPIAPVDDARQNDCSRDITVIGGILTGRKGLTSGDREYRDGVVLLILHPAPVPFSAGPIAVALQLSHFRLVGSSA